MAEVFSLGGMLLGASSAATQVKGGDRNNNWYDWYRRGNIKDGSDPSVATMHWERWPGGRGADGRHGPSMLPARA